MRIVFLIISFFGSILFSNSIIAQDSDSIVQFIFTSDLHFGSTKNQFRRNHKVPSWEVNLAMYNSMKLLPSLKYPNDNGVNSNSKISNIDEIIITGDIASRMENGVQSAKTSWNQFTKVYLEGKGMPNINGKRTSFSIVPGNHDMSNAVGYHRPMNPTKDASVMLGIYNYSFPSVNPQQKFDSINTRIHYSKNIHGIHLVFLSLWPDSTERKWMETDLLNVSESTPVLLFAHSVPDIEARFFINPNGSHDINNKDKFENLLPEMYKDTDSVKGNTLIEQRAFVQFLKKHTNIKAYFHGHRTFTEFYNWLGPDLDISLPCIRSDSPIHGFISDEDETKLAYNFITINTKAKILTVREVLWNAQKNNKRIQWGKSVNIKL